MSTDPTRNWASIYPLWISFCGVCDEYISLKSKWSFISSLKGMRALPNLKETFDRLDRLIETMNHEFSPMFDRLRMDDRNVFDANLVEARLNNLQDQFYSLTHYLGILKFVFFQRTVSYEIPDVISGFPLSPERTTGNETIYLASDNTAKRYLSCIYKDSELKWDGAISFAYPVQQDDFFGGISWPDKYLKHFHIVLSEENKHFLGALQILAHEVSHVAHCKIKDNRFFPNWLESMWRKVSRGQLDAYGQAVLDLEAGCSGCLFCKNLCTYLGNEKNNFEEFQQNVADLIALLIAGPTSCFVLIDMFLNSFRLRYVPLRPAFLYGYCLQSHLDENRIIMRTEISKMTEGFLNYLPLCIPSCPNLNSDTIPCFQLMLDIGVLGGQLFAFSERKILEEMKTELPTESVSYPPDVNSLTSALVKDRFEINSDIESRISEALRNRQTCVTEDPRHILHTYYLRFRNGSTPDYASTLYSLAHNTFQYS